MILPKIRNGVDSMKSPRIYEEAAKFPGIKVTIKIGKHTVPNNKISVTV